MVVCRVYGFKFIVAHYITCLWGRRGGEDSCAHAYSNPQPNTHIDTKSNAYAYSHDNGHAHSHTSRAG